MRRGPFDAMLQRIDRLRLDHRHLLHNEGPGNVCRSVWQRATELLENGMFACPAGVSRATRSPCRAAGEAVATMRLSHDPVRQYPHVGFVVEFGLSV